MTNNNNNNERVIVQSVSDVKTELMLMSLLCFFCGEPRKPLSDTITKERIADIMFTLLRFELHLFLCFT